MLRAIAWLALLCALLPRAAGACAACGCGDPTLTAMGVEKPFKNRIRLSLEELFGGHATGDGGSTERSWVLRSTLTGSWSPTAWLTVAALLPVVALWTQAQERPWRSLVGLGDGELSARALVFRDRKFSPRHVIGLLGGVKLPTGPRVSDSTGYPAADDDQPGSGSVDPFAGISYAWFGQTLGLFASTSARITTPGWHGYRRGSSVGGTVGLQLQPLTWGAVSLAADFRWADPDHLASGYAVPDTGGTTFSLTPSVLLTPREDWLIRLAFQVHVFDWWNGSQSESYTIVLATVVDL
jgi:hypothetical protein